MNTLAIPTLVSLVQDSIEIRSLSPRTRVSYEDLLELHIQPRWADTPVTEVSYRDLQKWLSGIAQTRPHLAHRIHVVIRQAIRLAVIDDVVSKNVADYVKLRVPVRKPVRSMQPTEFLKLVDALPTMRDVLIAQVMAVGGLRFCEVAGLRPDSVSSHGLHVDASVTPRRGGGFNFEPVKNHQERTVQLPPALLSALLDYADTRRRAGKTLLFSNAVGNPLDIGNWNARVLKSACRKAGIPVISAHVLRHTAATTALHAHVPPHVVARHLGHQDAAVTLAFYAGTWEAKLRDLASAVGSELLPVEGGSKNV